MHIDSYSFGAMSIGGKSYTSDVIIYPHTITANWWRKEDHRLITEDLEGVLAAKPQLLIVGTGAWGRMQIADAVRRDLEARHIRLIARATGEAVRIFNGSSRETENTIGAFHLTC